MDLGEFQTNLGFWEIKKPRSQDLMKTPKILGKSQALETLDPRQTRLIRVLLTRIYYL